MKDNKQIFNEAFFKKATYAEKRAKQFPQYSPVDPTGKDSAKPGQLTVPAYQVSDTDEVKKRLTGTFGVAFGSNNIKTMANRALKTFPIIISDNIEPETAVMLKKLMEEQYAEYINLLISNQVVNLSDFPANNPEGNIAIQALDKISGNDFSKSRLANLAVRKDNISADDVFRNIPLYNLLRENEFVISTGDTITDTLLEGAAILPSDKVDDFVDFILTEKEPITTPPNDEDEKVNREQNQQKKKDADRGTIKGTYLAKYYSAEPKQTWTNSVQNIEGERNTFDMARGYHGTDDLGREIYSKLTTGDVVIDTKNFNNAINRTVGEMLLDPKNREIKDRYEKATMLMQARRISGVEWYSYCTMRLGIPVSDEARKQAVQQFRASEIRKYGQGLSKEEGGKAGYVISKAELKAITENRIYTEKIVREVSKGTIKNVLIFSGIGAGLGAAAAGAGVATGSISIGSASAATALTTILAAPLAAGAIAGTLMGAGAYGLLRLIQKRKAAIKQYHNMTKTEGWERVEYLIMKLNEQQEEIRRQGRETPELMRLFADKSPASDLDNRFIDNKYKYAAADAQSSFEGTRSALNPQSTSTVEFTKAKKDYLYQIENAQRNIERSLREGIEMGSNNYQTFNEMYKNISVGNYAENINKMLNEAVDEFAKDSNFVAEVLTEKTLAKTTMPMKVQYVQKKEDKDLMMTPSFMARDTYAYGSTEIERKENKDRRYNQPLIMTIKFKERFSDGKYSDNELTAVIGILGKIIRVSSEEMEYILKENAQGKTIEGIFKTGDLKNSISDMLSTSKISRDLKSLPQSGDIWHNLEKVATLAAANKISGKRNDNVANAHIVFSQKEIDAVRSDIGVDYLRDTKKAVALMKRYSAFTLMVANDAGQRVYIMDDQDDISWNVVPYGALAGKDNGEQLNAVLNKMMRL